jgi:hypothetical protein
VRPEDVVCTGRTNGHANSFHAEVQNRNCPGTCRKNDLTGWA